MTPGELQAWTESNEQIHAQVEVHGKAVVMACTSQTLVPGIPRALAGNPLRAALKVSVRVSVCNPSGTTSSVALCSKPLLPTYGGENCGEHT